MPGMSPIIGKVMGIPIQLHWTFVLLLMVSLFYPVFFIYIVLLFVFVTLHELAHSITAKNNRIKVKRIILYPLGGGSVIDMNNVKPKIELKIALAGPASNFFIAAILGIITILIPGGHIRSLMQVLFLVNVFLGLLNIVPAFPLDGARVLRSYIQRTNTHLGATIKTARISNIIVVISIILAIAFMFVNNYTFTYRILMSVSFVIIAFYIYGGTQAELYSSKMKTEAGKLDIYEVISTDYITVTKTTTLSGLYKKVQNSHINTIIYRTKNNYMLVSKIPTDIYKTTKNKNAEHNLSTFSREIPNMSYKSKVSELLNKLELENCSAVAITKSNKLIGIVFKQYIEYIIALKISTKNTKYDKH